MDFMRLVDHGWTRILGTAPLEPSLGLVLGEIRMRPNEALDIQLAVPEQDTGN